MHGFAFKDDVKEPYHNYKIEVHRNVLIFISTATKINIFILFATKAEKKEQIHHRNAHKRPYSERNTLKDLIKDCTKTCEKIQ